VIRDAHRELSLLAHCAPVAADQGVVETFGSSRDFSQQQGDQVPGFVVQAAEVHGWLTGCGATGPAAGSKGWPC